MSFALNCSNVPQYAAALANLASSLLNLDQVEEAHRVAKEAIAADPDFAFAHFILEYIELRRNRRRAARGAFLEAVRLEPAAEHFHALAELYGLLDEHQLCLEATSSALDLDPTHLPSLLLRGPTTHSLGRYDEANELFALALEQDPEAPEAQQAMGQLHLSTGNAHAALHMLTEARRIDPVRSEHHVGDC